jgi:hypothetical protein
MSLQDQKRELLLESELNRLVLRLECQQMRTRASGLREHWRQNIWIWAAPVAGFLLARRLTKTSGLFAKGSLLAVALGKLWEFWQQRRQKAAED